MPVTFPPLINELKYYNACQKDSKATNFGSMFLPHLVTLPTLISVSWRKKSFQSVLIINHRVPP